MKIKIISGLIAGAILTVSAVLFIRYSNDHKECSTVTEKTVNTNSETVVTTKHVCKEKYSF